MKSHGYDFAPGEVAKLLGALLVPLALFALLMHGGAAARLLPAPWPVLDIDRTILVHQAEASLKAPPADVVLIGDSSCLMDVSALQLQAALHQSVLNLGTLSYLDLAAYASILKRYLANTPDPPRKIVLLMHPEALRRPSPTDYHVQALARFYARRDLCPPTLPPLLCWLGVETFRARVLSRAIPQPLGGSFGRQYGFTHDLWDYLSAHRGSALDPGDFDPGTATGSAEYRLASALERTSRAFREVVPAGVELVVGLTPVPQGFALPSYPQTRAAMLGTWAKWLRPDRVLDDVPGTMPDDFFASPTHLNAEGVAEFTTELGRRL